MSRELPLKVRVLNFFRLPFKIKWLEKTLAKLTEGKSPQHFFSKLVPNSYQYSKGSFRELYRDGIRIKVDISDYIGHFYYFGFNDKAMQHFFSLCKENYNVIDVGTNLGWTLLRLSSLAKHGIILGFEPDPINFTNCQQNISLNKFDNIQLFPFGLGNYNGLSRIEVRTPTNLGGNRIAVDSNNMGAEVHIVKLDDFQPVKNLLQIDLIKIDVEGYELHALMGAEKLLRKHHPTLFIELDDNNLKDQGHSAYTLIHFLQEIGYQQINHAETEEPITLQTGFTNCHFDIIAK